MPEEINIAIIGAGAVGLSIAHELSKTHEGVYVFEKAPFVGDGQSTRNSGVIHSGIYYPKDTLKSMLCLEGNRLLYDFCKKYDIKHRKTGKLLAAINEKEEKKLEELLELAKSKDMQEVAMLSSEQVHELEPNVHSTKALYLGTTGIVDAGEYVNKLAQLARLNCAEILTRTEVLEITAKNSHFTLKTNSRGEIDARYLINAAGLYSDVIAGKINPEQQYQITPIRGEYYSFRANGGRLETRMNVYPTPRPDTLGIHLTPTFDGNKIIVGPTAIPIMDKENYTQDRKDVKYFHSEVKDFFPNLREEDLSEDYAGIRAKLKGIYDFVIKTDEKYPNCLQFVGIDSPGLTSSQAIGKRVRISNGQAYFDKN